MSDEPDTRRPTDFAAKALPRWDSASDKERIGICVRIRTDAFLEYPQTDPEAFAELRKRCREIENPVPWFPKPSDEPVVLTRWQKFIGLIGTLYIHIKAFVLREKVE